MVTLTYVLLRINVTCLLFVCNAGQALNSLNNINLILLNQDKRTLRYFCGNKYLKRVSYVRYDVRIIDLLFNNYSSNINYIFITSIVIDDVLLVL